MSEAYYTETKKPLDENLNGQYDWFYRNFLPAIQLACDEFFSEMFTFKLISISKNMNVLFQGTDYFVTKVRIDKQHDVFFRCSEETIKIILEKVLGKDEKRFDLSKITELEAKIISAFNDYLYAGISPLLLAPEPNKKRKNFDTVHLTFFLKDNQGRKDESAGKFILSLPEILLTPNTLKSIGEKFGIDDFATSQVEVDIKVGTTKFPVKDLKLLEKEDIVIFEDSNIQSMRLIYGNYQKNFRITPNPGLIISIDNNDGGNNMEENSSSQNLWDNIQVEMGAEFDTVKISLGELKNIEQGLVVDISSVYNNKISLKVENKVIARGELLIVNDRYGVRIDEVLASSNPQQESSEQTEQMTETQPDAQMGQREEAGHEEEFDYSDFELDDQDI